jgi:hypothetical protein
MDRLFLDANVLFSAAYRADAGLHRLWTLRGVVLVSSAYALAGAGANLETAEQRARLDHLAAKIETVQEEPAQAGIWPAGVQLPDKDRPILLAAIRAGATHLLTGDPRHFGPYFGKTIAGVKILPPGDYLLARGQR